MIVIFQIKWLFRLIELNVFRLIEKKDPGVPNSYPFKEQVLKEAEERKQRVSMTLKGLIMHVFKQF